MALHVDPRADWMTPEIFVAGGVIDQRTADLRRAHGARALSLWRDSVTQFAAGRPVTCAIIEQHNRLSLDHWCMARAAEYAVLDRLPVTAARGQVPRAAMGLQEPPGGVRPMAWGRR